MGEEAVCLTTVLRDNGEMAEDSNGSKIESKRPHECIEDSPHETETSPKKKPAKETSIDESNSEVLNPIVSLHENASSSPTSLTQPIEGSSRSGCEGIPSTSTGNSSTESTDNEEQGRDRSTSTESMYSGYRNVDSTSLTATSEVVLEASELASSSGIKKIVFKFAKSKDNGDGASSCISQPRSSGYDNGMTYSRFHLEPPEINPSDLVDTPIDMALGTSGLPFSESKSRRCCAPKMELKMSKKVVLNSCPTNVKKLLSTGILDGARVKYMKGEKVMLHGIISSSGYLCGCSSCNFSEVLNAYEFEQHAGCETKHPNSYVVLENGRSIYSIVYELRSAPLNLLDEVVQDLAGESVNEKSYQVWKESREDESLQQIEIKREEEIKPQLQPRGFSHSTISFHGRRGRDIMDNIRPSSRSSLQKYPVKQIKSWMPDPRERKRPRIPSQFRRPKSSTSNSGRAKKRDNDLHRLLFLPSGLPDGAELAYYAKGQKLLKGYKQGNGIVCSCCDSEISPSQFEAHAGWSARRQPYRHIYTSNGLSLHDLALSLSNGQNLTTRGSYDICTVCGDVGDLFLCDGCPRAFHPGCLELHCSPQGVWNCPYCRDKIGIDERETAFSEPSSSISPMSIRLSRVVKAPAAEIGGCVVCRGHDFSVSRFDERTVMLCDQCEKEYHVGCLRDSGLCDLKELPEGKWFCCEGCSWIHDALDDLIFSGPKEIPSPLFSTINRKLMGRGLTDEVGVDVQWQLLSGKLGSPDHRPLLSKAAAIFRDGFNPIVCAGRDLIPAMVYGRSIVGQDFGGMYCAVLSVRSVVVSAGILRVFSSEVAELPLVATIKHSQGKGYFQALFSCIQRLLCYLNVENLVLPAAEEAESIWTNKFGFTRMSEERLQTYTKDFQLTIFKSTSMLEKPVPRIEEYQPE